MAKKQSHVTIQGVNINLESEQLKAFTTPEEVSSIGLFDHLEEGEIEKAEKKLCEQLGISFKKKDEATQTA